MSYPENPRFNLKVITLEKQARFNPLTNLTPATLSAALNAFRTGTLRELALIMDAQEERDDVLANVVPKAKAAVARHGWEILTVDTEDEAQAARAAKQKEVLEQFYNNLRVTSALDQDELGGVSLLLRQMMDAKGKRYAVHNIVWKAMAGGRYTATLWFVPLWFFENRTGRLRFIESSFGYDGVTMDPTEWLVTKGQGVSIACSVAWMYKHLPLRDWLAVSQRFGDALIEGITDASENSPEWDALAEAVADLAGGDAIVHSRGADIKITMPGQLGNLPQPALVERMDRAMAGLWRGADLSTISAGQGQGQGASLQGDEADIIEQDCAAWLSETLNLKLDRLVLDNVFGPDEPALAYFRVATANKQNTELDLKIDEFLVRNGHHVSKKQIAERYNRPLPDAGDEVLTAPAAPAPFSPGGMFRPSQPAINERTADARFELFRAQALRRVTRAQAESLRPLTDRLSEILGIEDEAAQDAALLKLQNNLPGILKTSAKDPELIAAWEEIFGAALASGATEARRNLLPNPPTP